MKTNTLPANGHSREAFASAERLAFFAHDHLHLSGMALLDCLHTWRDRYGVALSNWALRVIASHVTRLDSVDTMTAFERWQSQGEAEAAS